VIARKVLGYKGWVTFGRTNKGKALLNLTAHVRGLLKKVGKHPQEDEDILAEQKAYEKSLLNDPVCKECLVLRDLADE